MCINDERNLDNFDMYGKVNSSITSRSNTSLASGPVLHREVTEWNTTYNGQGYNTDRIKINKQQIHHRIIAIIERSGLETKNSSY
jgi:hypothetical protein